MDLKDMVNIYNGALLHLLKQGILPYVVTWMNVKGITLNDMNQPERTNIAQCHSYKVNRIVKHKEIGCSMWLPCAGMGNCYSMNTFIVQSCKMSMF